MAGLLSVAALIAIASALVINNRAQQPIGEGQLFLADGQAAVTALGSSPNLEGLKRVRNALTIEAVSLVTSDGTISISSSLSLQGQAPASPLTVGFAERGRFGAVAAATPVPITIDGVTEWEAGAIIYEVVQPLGNGQSVLLTYDMSELLARRSTTSGIPPLTLELLAGAGALGLLAFFSFVARGRAERAYVAYEAETRFLRRESEALNAVNIELDQARKKAERATELAEEKNRIRSEFVLMINHELRTPLTGVVTGADLLSSEGAVTDPTWQAILRDIQMGGHRLSEMIDQILAVARIENGALFFELEPTQMETLIGRLLEVSPDFLVDGTEFSQVLRTDATTAVNLIRSLADNAVKHGATTVRLSMATDMPFTPLLEIGTRPSNPLFVVLSDNGPGIDLEFLPRAFEKFEKDSASSGTGLGLYIAQMMTEALEGSMLVDTSPDGTSIAIALPSLVAAEVPA
jgi:signal transduction histidine kinase